MSSRNSMYKGPVVQEIEGLGKKGLEVSRDWIMQGLQTIMRGFKGSGRGGHGQTCVLKRPCSFSPFSQSQFSFTGHTFLRHTREESQQTSYCEL